MPLSETVLVVMLLLAVGVLAAGIFRHLPIPYTVLLVVIGLLLSGLSGTVPLLEPLQHFRLTPELVLFIFLPTLIFESGLNLDARLLIKDVAPVMMLAVPALLISTFIVGLGVAAVLPVSIGVALVFGALISATDPVAVVALFKELGTPKRLTTLVEGESLLNDATAIVLVNILLAIALSGHLGAGDIGLAVTDFLVVFIGGALIGVMFGWLFGWLMAQLQAGISMTLILSLVMAYTSFIVAEHALHVSGVMAVASCAVVLGDVGVPRLPRKTGTALTETWEFLALICNTLLFIMIGFAVDIWHVVSRWEVILMTTVLLLAGRAATIYTLVPMTTRLFHLPRVILGERHIMWWGGLKGGLAIAIVLSLPEDLPGRNILLDLTLGVVVFSLLVNAPTVRPFIRYLGIDRLTDDERAECQHTMKHARDQAEDCLQQFLDAGLLSRASHHQTLTGLQQAMDDSGDGVAREHRFRRHRLNTLRTELLTLEDIYQSGVINYYTFIDLKGELGRAREHTADPLRQTLHTADRSQNPFLRLEDALIRRFREKDLAAGLLARYQNLRLSQHLLKDIVRVLMCRAALQYVESEVDMEMQHRDDLRKVYGNRLKMLSQRILGIQQNYPDFYAGFESRLALRTALTSALRKVEEEAHEGTIGGKGSALLERRLTLALASLPPVTGYPPALAPGELLEMIPLFQGLDKEARDSVTQCMKPVNYLADDTIIGEGEHGDALYVVVRGRVTVWKRNETGEDEARGDLTAGDFFGELALLGEQVRQASVRARQASTLLRLRRRDVLLIAEEHPEIEVRLREAERL